MRATIDQSSVWALARSQHGVVTRRQLLERGYTAKAIRRRLDNGRLHPVRHGVYAVGRPELTPLGVWMAAVLSCGPGALLSHESAAVLWGIVRARRGDVHVSVVHERCRQGAGIAVHRRSGLTDKDRARHRGIPVTSPICTLIDLAPRLSKRQLEAAVNEADALDLVDPERLRAGLDRRSGRPGVKPLRTLLDRLTFVLTDSDLERLFLPLVRKAGLPLPITRTYVDGFKVDFHWPDLNLVVETDSLRYHRTPAQQARDRLRDQAHLVAGRRPLRFTHAQVKYEPAYVEKTLRAIA